MSDRLVTVATFDDSIRAALARNYLEAAGIMTELSDEATVATAWGLSGAVGGIKLQVAAWDLERAEHLLNRLEREQEEKGGHEPPSTAVAAPRDAAQVAAEDAEDRQAEEEEKNPSNQLADRAFRAAVIGVLFWPVQLYALWLLLTLGSAEQGVSPDRRWKVWAAALIAIPALFVPPLFCVVPALRP